MSIISTLFKESFASRDPVIGKETLGSSEPLSVQAHVRMAQAHAESTALAAIREQARAAHRQGIFFAAGVGSVLWRLIFPDSKVQVASVGMVDTFVSHSWASTSWLKFLAICHHFNLDLALTSSLMAWILAMAVTVIRAGGFSMVDEDMIYLGVTLICFPLAIFTLMYFGGHLFSRRYLWFDQVCVSEAHPFAKLQTLQSIPSFVSSSNELLVLWDETFWERLWCIYEAWGKACSALLCRIGMR